MGLAERERQMAANGVGCLGKAKSDEPVFILRAQDVFASRVVRIWALLVEHVHGSPSKVKEARALADAMDEWHERGNAQKVPD